MVGRRPLTDEERERNNIKRRERRLKNNLDRIQKDMNELEATKLPEPEVIENIEDPDEVQKRKMEIAEKRLKALELARSKKISPSQIRKNNEEEVMRIKAEKEQEMMIKEQEMMKMKEENEKLKAIAEEKQKVKIVKKYVSTPIPIPMKKKKSPRPQEVAVAVPSTEYLVQQTYAEQLQERMRQAMLNKVMASTFGS